jgi:hypothetical protein
MSKAARNARKAEQRETGVKYQHPTREGVPYGRSKGPSPTVPFGDAESEAVLRILHSRVKGFADGGFR